jgi:hypothetical protein
MKCAILPRWLKENPEGMLSGDLRVHLAQCDSCRRLWEEQQLLASALKSVPHAEPPLFFEARIKESVFSGKTKTAVEWIPLLAPLAALLVAALTAAYFITSSSAPQKPLAEKPVEIILPAGQNDSAPKQNPPPTASESVDIYPVWPEDGAVVSGDDVSIMASLYPAPPPGTMVFMSLNGLNVTDRIRTQGEIVSYEPGSIEPGRYVVTITLREAEGQTRSVTYTFFALEAAS